MNQMSNEINTSDLFSLNEQDLSPIPSVPTIEFTTVAIYTTFLVEYTFKDNDIVIHFFPSTEVHQLPNAQHYWLSIFPEVLDRVARSSFGVEPPRLEGQFIEAAIPSSAPLDDQRAVPSWYLRARGFVKKMDPEWLLRKFFATLDTELDPLM
jgi:hypothetical protein